MDEIHHLSTSLKKATDGIWYSSEEEAISYPADGNESCFALEEHSFWFKHRNACIAEVVSAFPPRDNGAIFDIGGGNGFVSFGLANAGFEVVLVEPGRSGAANARKRGLANVICATTQTAKFKEKSLSAVGLFDVLEHIKEDKSFLLSINALVKDHGFLYLTVPAYFFLWSKDDDLAGHFRRYSLKAASSVLASAGFEVIYASYIFRFLPLPIFLLRTVLYKLGLANRTHDHKKVATEHTVSNRLLVHILNGMQAAEIVNIRNKKTMHFGGSCLLVAKKSS